MESGVNNVVYLSDAKRRFMEQYMRRTPEDIYQELSQLKAKVDMLNSEIYRLRQEMLDYEQ